MQLKLHFSVQISINILSSLCFILFLFLPHSAVGQLVVNEIMYHPPDRSEAGEYIELYHVGDQPVSLQGWKLEGAVKFEFPDIVLFPQRYLVVVSERSVFRSLYPNVNNIAGEWSGKLSNRSEEISLVSSQGEIVDQVAYADEGDWSYRILGPVDYGFRGWVWSKDHDGGGRSLELINPFLDNEFGQSWETSLVENGTPGGVNSVGTQEERVIVADVRHFPTVPLSRDAITIVAEVIHQQPDEIRVVLRVRIDGQDSFQTMPMLDDGQTNDLLAGDNVYGAILEPQEDKSIVEFYIETYDSASRRRTYPPPAWVDKTVKQASNLLLLVSDEMESITADEKRSQPVYFLVMTDSERKKLEAIGDGTQDVELDEFLSNAQMNATFVGVDEEGIHVRYNAGVRNRGAGTRFPAPNNFRVNFSSDRLWRDQDSINFNSKYTHVQLLGSRLFELAGYDLSSEDAEAVQLRVNGENLSEPGERMFGSYVMLEPFDRDFLKNHFPHDEDGNAYEAIRGEDRLPAFSHYGEDIDRYKDRYLKITKRVEEDYTDLIDLTRVLSEHTPDSSYVKEIKRVLNVDQWMRYFAVNTLQGNNESNLTKGQGDDFYLYRGEGDTRFVIIPHDHDSMFGRGEQPAEIDESIYRATQNQILARFLRHPTFESNYLWHLYDLAHTIFSDHQFGSFVDEVVGDYVSEEERNQIKEYVRARREHVLSTIAKDLRFSVGLPLKQDYFFAKGPFVAISGLAGLTPTKSVTVNGVLAAWNPLRGEWFVGETEPDRTVDLVSKGSEWSFYSEGEDLGDSWKAFDYPEADEWKTGFGELGYGDGDEETDLGSPPRPRPITAYFRRSFQATEVSRFSVLELNVLRDDGARVFLNEEEIGLSNLPQGPKKIRFSTPALNVVPSAEEKTYFGISSNLNASVLKEGTNLLAVEIHQASEKSSDLSFDLELLGVVPKEVPLSGVPIGPGISHLVVESFDGPQGTGRILDQETIRVYREFDADGASLSGTLDRDIRLSEDQNPWRVESDLTVPEGVTLTIQPGVNLFFGPGTKLIVEGTLLAEGEKERPIVMTYDLESGLPWNGIHFSHSENDNRLVHVHQEYAHGGEEAIRIEHSRLLIDQMTWTDVKVKGRSILELIDSNVEILNSRFPRVDRGETIHGNDIPVDGYLVIEGNTFERVTGYSDVIDFRGGQRPHAIIQILNNVFLGGGDDGVDLDGSDAHIEGNLFMNFKQDQVRISTANAISTGRDNRDPMKERTSNITVARNIFANNDHDVLLKENARMTASHNTFFGSRIASIQFDEIEARTVNGAGALLEGNIFWPTESPFLHTSSRRSGSRPGIIVRYNIINRSVHHLGEHNLDEDPLFVSSSLNNFVLREDSPAVSAGPSGLDMGGMVPSGLTISGEPELITKESEAVLLIYGPGVTHYRYSLDKGPFSEEVEIEKALFLNNLSVGMHSVQVVGRNSAGVWTEPSEAVQSAPWYIVP